jgi:hypothetical protein
MDYVRWRFYRAADLASVIGASRIILPFPSRSDIPEKQSFRTLRYVLQELFHYEHNCTWITAFSRSFGDSGFKDSGDGDLRILKGTGRFEMIRMDF